jgi:sugar lactone lactonase YvrE
VAADGYGGAFITQTGVYHIAANGAVSVVAEGNGLFTNGLVLSPDGKTLYVTNRNTILAFAGPDKRTLYIGAMGAADPDGKAWTTPEGVRNVAMTLYRLTTLASGPAGRPK